MWNNLFTIFDPEKKIQFNTLDGPLAIDKWLEYEDYAHLIHRNWEGELPVLGEWIPSNIEYTESLPFNNVLQEDDEDREVYIEDDFL